MYLKLLWVVLASFILIACQSAEKQHKDYSFLISQSKNNAVEIDRIVSYYKAQNELDKIKSIEFVLDNISDQYAIKYSLINGDNRDTISHIDGLSVDSIFSMIRNNYKLEGDTTWDIDIIKSKYLIKHIEKAYSSWRDKQLNKKLSFEDFTNYLLPYRAQNEQLDDFIQLLENRYDFNNILQLNSENDSLMAYNFASLRMTNERLNNSHGAEFLSNPSYYDIYFNHAPFHNYENTFLVKMKILRYFGIAAMTSYTFSSRNDFAAKYTSSIFDYTINRKEKGKKELGISKMYRSAFQKKEWDNPYDQLKLMGIAPSNIPISLFIPKMKDITDQVTFAKDITLQLSDKLLGQKVIYLCHYSNDKWQAVSYGIVNESGSVTFKKMGCGVLYQMMICSSAHNQELIGLPIIVDTTGTVKTIDVKKNESISMLFSYYSYSSKLRPLEHYDLYYWNIDKSKWMKLQAFKSNEEGGVLAQNINPNGLYKWGEEWDNSKGNIMGPRIFTISNDNKQEWW